MLRLLGQLMTVVSGQKADRVTADETHAGYHTVPAPSRSSINPVQRRLPEKSARQAKIAAKQIIPFDDDDFSDF
jgi:hypothetical protein